MKLSALFSDHMVLQRGKPINIWGQGEGKVCLRFGGSRYYTVCDGGKWSVVIPPMPAGGPYELIISDESSSVTLRDVMIGEVWLAAGQSNMEHSLFSAVGGLEAAKKWIIRMSDCLPFRAAPNRVLTVTGGILRALKPMMNRGGAAPNRRRFISARLAVCSESFCKNRKISRWEL